MSMRFNEDVFIDFELSTFPVVISQGLKYRDLQPCFHVYAILEAYGGQIPAKQFEAWVDITTGKVDYSKSINSSSAIGALSP